MEAEKILLVDTEKNILLTYKTALEDENYQVDIAINLQEALGKIAQNKYSILISELYLKNTNTLGIINNIQNDNPETYIIILTASLLSPNTYQKVISAGVQDCFVKPFPVKNLLSNIKKGLERRQLIIKLRDLEEKVNMIKNIHHDQSTINGGRNFLKTFQHEQKRFERYNHPFSVIMVDFNFTTFEEPIIPSKGIKEIFSVLLTTVRSTDYSSQFNNRCTLILPETTQSGTQNLMGRLKDTFETKFPKKDTELYRKLSQGLRLNSATYPDESKIIMEWITAIDPTY